MYSLEHARLERELARDLAPVAAPRELWMLICNPAQKARPRRTTWPWAALGSLAAAALALVFALAPSNLARLAASELAQNETPDFQSNSPQAISHWLQEHAGVNLALPAGTKVELRGACTMKNHGAIVGGVMYRVAGQNAVLLVSRATKPEAAARHGESTWSEHGQVYALAFAGGSDMRLACQLCHVD